MHASKKNNRALQATTEEDEHLSHHGTEIWANAKPGTSQQQEGSKTTLWMEKVQQILL